MFFTNINTKILIYNKIDLTFFINNKDDNLIVRHGNGKQRTKTTNQRIKS